MSDADGWEIELTEDDLLGGDDEAVWAINEPAVEAFLICSTQWRLVALSNGPVRTIGLDYAGARPALDMSGIDVTPELWADLQVIERGAIAARNEV
jgi:Phage related hypothetical protein (DUF1799)